MTTSLLTGTTNDTEHAPGERASGSRRIAVHKTLITRSLLDRMPSALKAAGALGFYAVVGSWIYSGFSADFDEILVDFPEELTALMGGSLVGATGGYITSVMMNLIGPLVFVGLAVSWGARSIAGEEADQTARLLFAQPISRRQVLLDRALVIAVATLASVAIFAASLMLATALFDDTAPSIANVVAAGLHLSLFAIAMGMISLAAGSATGSKTLGVLAGAGVAVVSYFVDAFAPLTAAEGIERFTPWHLYNGSTPIENGLHLGHLAMQLGLAGGFLAVGWWAVNGRDLEASQGRRRIALGGSPQRVTSVFARTLSVRSGAVAAVGGVLAAMAVGMAVLFDSVGESFDDIELPAALEDAFGGSSLASPVGWMNAELLSIVAPLCVLGLAISMGLDAIAGERERRTLALVLSAAPTRRSFITEKLAAMAVVVTAVSAAMAVGLFVGSAIGGLDLSADGIVGASVQLGALGLFFGAVATAAGAVLPRRTAFGFVIGLVAVSFLSQTLLSAIDGPRWILKLSPWDYYIGNNPLDVGVSAVNVAVLLGLTGVVVFDGLMAFDRADAA